MGYYCEQQFADGYPCAIGEYYYWNTSCLDTCDYPFINKTASGNRTYCMPPCATGQFYYWNDTCINTCAFPLTQRTLGGVQYCDYSCDDDEFLKFDGICVTDCDAPYKPRIEANKSYCDPPCASSQYLTWNLTCVATCDLPLKERIETIKYCDYPCDDDETLFWDGLCAKKCDSNLREVFVQNKSFCQYPCDNIQYLYWNGTCGDMCDYPWLLDVKRDRYFCDFPCTDSQYLYWNNSCLDSCNPPVIPLVKAKKNYCLPACPTDTYQYWDNNCSTTCDYPRSVRNQYGASYCDYPCKDNEYLYWNATCHPQCNTPLTVTTDTGKQFCNYQCSEDQYLYWDGSCSTECKFPLRERKEIDKYYCDYPCQPSEFLHMDGTCTPSCSSPDATRVEKSRNFCDVVCASNEFTYWNGTCDPDCDLPYTAVGKLCDYPCVKDEILYWNGSCFTQKCDHLLNHYFVSTKEFCGFPCKSDASLYDNGTCADDCDSRFRERIEGDRSFCDYPCHAGQFLYWDGYCSEECDFPLVKETVGTNQHFCHFPCTTSEYLWYNGSCMDNCPSPYVSADVGGYKYCNPSCSASQFMLYNGTCVDECLDPMKITPNEGTVSSCLSPCKDRNQFFFYDETCIDECLPPYMSSYFNYNFCGPSCLTTQYMLTNGTCIDECPSPMKNESHTRTKVFSCYSPCPDPATPYYLTDTKKCSSRCPTEPFWNTDLYALCYPVNNTDAPQVTLVKLLHHLKYLSKYLPTKLQNVAVQRGNNILSMRVHPTTMDTPRDEVETQNVRLLASSIVALGSSIENAKLYSSFVSNFFDDLCMLAIMIILEIVLAFLHFIASRFNWQKTKSVTGKIRILTRWNLPLSLLATNVGDIIFFAYVEFKNYQPGTHHGSFSLSMAIGMCLLVVLLYAGTIYLLRAIKKAQHRAKLLKVESEYINCLIKWKNFQVLFGGCSISYPLYRPFYLIYCTRLALPMIFAAFLTDYPLVQTILYAVISISMIVYVIWRKPVQNKLDYINIFVLEGVMFTANAAALALVGMYMAGSTNENARNILGQLIIVASFIINYMSIIFLISKVVSNARLALMHRKSAYKYEEKAVWLNMLFLPFQQGGMGFEQVQLLQGGDTGKQVSKIIPDQTNFRLVKNVSVAGSSATQNSPDKDRVFPDLDSTVMGSPSPLKKKQDRRTRFSFKKAITKDVIDPVVEGIADVSASNILAPSLNITQHLEGSVTNRDLLPSGRDRANSPLLKVRASDELPISNIELDESNNLMGNLSLFKGISSPDRKGLTLETSPSKPEQSQAATPELVDSPVQRLVTPDQDRSFLARAKLRIRGPTFVKNEEEESVFTLSQNAIKDNISSRKDDNISEKPAEDDAPILKAEKPFRRRRITRLTDE